MKLTLCKSVQCFTTGSAMRSSRPKILAKLTVSVDGTVARIILTHHSEFQRMAGLGSSNRTSYLRNQRQWGTTRPHYAHVMFEYERKARRNPDYAVGDWYHNGLLVIDYWRFTIRNFRDIPAVLSSRFEGAYMEPSERIDSRIAHHDFRSRM